MTSRQGKPLDDATRARIVRLVTEHDDRWRACGAVAERLGLSKKLVQRVVREAHTAKDGAT